MSVNLANLMLLLPIASALAVILGITGSQIVRVKLDGIRVWVLVVIWQLLGLGLVGLFLRLFPTSELTALIAAVLAITVLAVERGLARNMILLTLMEHQDQPQRLASVAHYLAIEGRGYWKRLGMRFGRAFQATGDWVLAVKQAKIARDEHDYMALAIQEHTGSRPAALHQIMLAIEFRQLGSVWRGRLVAAAISFVPLMIVGIVFSPLFGRRTNVFADIMREYSYPTTWPMEYWQTIAPMNVHILVPLLVWGLIVMTYVLKSMPFLSRHAPACWLFRSYHRALCLAGLSEIIKQHPQAAQACRIVASAMPVRSWSKRLSRTAERIEAGDELASALRKGGLLKRHESAAIAMCRDSKSLAWILHEISQSIWLRWQTINNLLVQLAVLLLVLVAAGLTASLAMYVFGWLAQFIQATESLR